MSAVDLQRFCNPKDVRRIVRRPFSFAGGAVGLNGEILVWHSRVMAEPFGSELGKVKEYIEGCIATSKMADGWLRAVDAPTVDALPQCKHCYGNGFVRETPCDDCDGGEFWHGVHTYVCKECEGDGCATESCRAGDEGAKACGYCGSTGVAHRAVRLDEAGTRGISSRYLQWLQELPECEFRLSPNDDTTGINFRFEGGCGIVMPMRNRA